MAHLFESPHCKPLRFSGTPESRRLPIAPPVPLECQMLLWLVTAIENHDPQAAENVARVHIRGSHRARLTMMLERDLDPNLQQQLPVKGLSNT